MFGMPLCYISCVDIDSVEELHRPPLVHLQ